MILLAADDPVAVALVGAIQHGEGDALRDLLAHHPGLANAHIGSDHQSRTPLHIATDWPGHFANVSRQD